MTRSRPALIAVVATLVLALPVLASHVQPRVVDGAESCGPLSPGTVELLVDATALDDGAVAQGDFEAEVSLEGTVETGTVAFRNATLPVRSALVAGATSSNYYEYEEPVTEDDGLVAPDGQPIVSVSFCYLTDDGGQANGDAQETDGDRTPPRTDAAQPAASGRTPGLPLVVAGLGALAAAALLAARPSRPRPVHRRIEDRHHSAGSDRQEQ